MGGDFDGFALRDFASGIAKKPARELPSRLFADIMGLSSHGRAARLLAAVAGLGALLAMRHAGRVLLALVAADFTDFGAFAHHVLGVLRIAGHEAGSQGADVGAVAVDTDAAGHHLHILFFEAGGGAMFAGGDAGVEGVEEGLVLGVHGKGSLV